MAARTSTTTTNTTIFTQFFIAAVLILLTSLCRAFNLDLSHEHLKSVQGPTGSFFGFRIQAYQNIHNETMLVVSAPRQSNYVGDAEKTTLVRGHGGLFICHQNDNKCNRPFFFETKKALLQKENRTNQNLGWSLQVGDGHTPTSSEVPLIACAPMWRFRHGNVSEMTGACFLSRIDRGSDSILVDGPNTTPFYPCLYRDSENCQSSWSPVGSGQENPMREHCTCIDGFSAALVKGSMGGNGRRPKPGVVVLGAPGGTYWAGGAFAAPLHGAWMVNNDAVPDFRAISAGPKEKRDNNSFEFDNGLFGYAMAFYSVDIPSQKQRMQGLAISGIKTKALGEVVLAAMSLARNDASIDYFKNNSVVRGTQLSEAFGFSLACGDVNGDGLPEIFVGAPFFFTNLTAGEGRLSKDQRPDPTARSYDSGRVYIFSTLLEESDVYEGYGPSHNLVFDEGAPVLTLDGLEDQARFGSAVEFLGDINDDGFGDIAVAAPYGGAQNLGVVYIYLGSANGITTNAKPSQVIEASRIPQLMNGPSISSGNHRSTMFGSTLQGRYDVDSNDYPDLLIGAIGADTVVVVRSRPVAKLTASVKVDPGIIGSPHGEAPANCKGAVDGTTYICATLLYCFDYTGKSLPRSLEVALSIEADILLTSVSSALAGRAFFEDDKPALFKRITMHYDSKYCGQEQVQFLRSPADLLTPIVFHVALSTVPSGDSQELVPIFATGETFSTNASAEIAKDCGADNICIPNFRVDLSRSATKFVILGDTKPYLVNFTISNLGEEAYGGSVNVVAPAGARFNGRDVYEILADGTSNKLMLSELVCSPRSANSPLSSSTISNSAEITSQPAGKNSGGSQVVTCILPQPFRTRRSIEIRLSFSMASIEIAEESEVAFNISVASKNPELNSTLGDNRAQLFVRIRPDLAISLQVFPDPEQVVYEENDYPSIISRSYIGAQQHETQIGPHLFIEILVSNSGPTVASKINVTANWPMDPFRNHSLLYLVEPPYLTRGRGRCFAGPPINPLRVTVDAPRGLRLSRPSLTAVSVSHYWNDADPTKLHCYATNVGAGDFARFVLRTRLIAKNVNMLFSSQRSFGFLAQAIVVKLPTTSMVPVDVSAKATAHVDVVTRIADFSLAHVDLWIIAVAIGAGLLTVLLVLLSLWLAGCFDRKVRRPKANYVKLATFEPIKTQAKRVPVVAD